jgi:hypothetical protein
MTQPQLKEMNNRDALQHGFHDVWKTKFVVPEEINLTTLKDICSG